MQIYIIGIGQCGTSIAFDVISQLTGFTKSKEVTSSPQQGGSEAAGNELLRLLNRDLGNRDRWRGKLKTWVGRLVNPASPGKTFIQPQIAIVDGNPDNFVKDAFQRFRGALPAKDPEDGDIRRLAELINGTRVLDLGDWNDGCANSVVGEIVASLKLPGQQLRGSLGVNNLGALGNDNVVLPVRMYLVVSSAGGATGSGGGVYLGQSDAVAAHVPKSPLVLNALVLPGVQSSADNPKYALNAGRALARYAHLIVRQEGEAVVGRKSSAVLFSNPPDEGDPEALQTLNDYMAEFSIRLANFTFAGNVARMARDLDPGELTSFLSGKVSVLGMSCLTSGWQEDNVEQRLVSKAFEEIYSSRADDDQKPQGLSVERELEIEADSEPLDALSGATSALVVLGVPPKFPAGAKLRIEKINKLVREFSKSKMGGGVRTFSYGSANDLEFTVLLRYRNSDACPLVRHFMGRYVNRAEPGLEAGDIAEIEYLKRRAHGNDDYAELFGEIVGELEKHRGLDHFGERIDQYVLKGAGTA